MEKRTKKFSRRQLLKGGALAGAGLLVPWHLHLPRALAGGKASVNSLLTSQPSSPDPPPIPGSQFYTAPLPAAIPVAKPKNRVNGVASYYEMVMKQGSYKFHPSLTKTTPTWGYDDTQLGYLGYLGPTLEVRKFEQVAVKWINKLPTDVDAPFGLADPNLIPGNLPGGRAVVHVHGGHNLEQFDGGPENWFVPGQSRTYYYPNIQDAASMWYHDHAIGVTRLNAYAGLAGLYLLRDSFEDNLNLPKGAYEIPLIIQDKAFWDDGTNLNLWYPNPWEPESFGNSILVNTQLWPVLEVEPRRYRFRIYNAANARFFRLRLSNVPGGTNPVLPFHQIGAEGGFLPKSAKMDVLLVGNGERADVIVDFKEKAGQDVYLTNDAATPFDPGQPPLDPGNPDDFNVMQIMKFHVKSTGGRDRSIFVPAALRPIDRLNPKSAAVKRNITLVENPYGPDPPGFMQVLLNNRPFVVNDGVITETPKLGTTEVWQFINLTPDTHPMHMHLVTFQVVNRQKLVYPEPYDPDTVPYKVDFNGFPHSTTGAIPDQYLDGAPRAPEANETGFKDTVRTNPGEVTRVIAKFEHFTGKFVYHCHILDHEENDMMQYMRVRPALGKESTEEVAGNKPTEYLLQQNYPNPFNPETTIRFQLPEDGHVVLRIFNTAGQEVSKLIDGDLAAGSHAVNFNARSLASGVYYYRIEAGSFAALKKMVLLK